MATFLESEPIDLLTNYSMLCNYILRCLPVPISITSILPTLLKPSVMARSFPVRRPILVASEVHVVDRPASLFAHQPNP